jgi:hypothetical protein
LTQFWSLTSTQVAQIESWFDDPHRGTRDLDLLGFGIPEPEPMLETFRDSRFRRLKKLSATALSWQLPCRLIE